MNIGDMTIATIALSIRKRTKREMVQHVVDYYEDRGSQDWSMDVIKAQMETELNSDPSFAYSVTVDTKNPLLDNMFNNSTVLTVGKLDEKMKMVPGWLNDTEILDVLCEKRGMSLFYSNDGSRKIISVSIGEKNGEVRMFDNDRFKRPERSALEYLVEEAEKLNGNDNPAK